MAVSLSGSVSSLQSSLQLLESATDTLDAGVSDFPRLCKVLQTTRVCFTIGDQFTCLGAQEPLILTWYTSTSSSSQNPPSATRKKPSSTKSRRAYPIFWALHRTTSTDLHDARKRLRPSAHYKKDGWGMVHACRLLPGKVSVAATAAEAEAARTQHRSEERWSCGS